MSHGSSLDADGEARPRVLLVDDNQAVLDRAAAILHRTCDVVGRVTDGPAALKAAAALRPDVIVLDISMPGMSGFEVASRLRESGSTAVIVFLTVYDEEEFLDAALAVGGTGYVVKPRITSDLAIAVREARAGRCFVSRDLRSEPPGSGGDG